MFKQVKYVFGLVFFLFSCAIYADASVSALLRQKHDPIAGNPKGKITLVEFFDYQCSHCANMVSSLNSIIKNNPDLRVVFKEYPIRGTESELAARAALAANLQGKYAAFNHAIFASNFINENNLLKIAKNLNLNINKFKRDMVGSTITTQIQNNYNLARTLGVNGTPMFFIAATNAQVINNDNVVPGEVSESELQNVINRIKSTT